MWARTAFECTQATSGELPDPPVFRLSMASSDYGPQLSVLVSLSRTASACGGAA